MSQLKNANRQIKIGAVISYVTIAFNIVSGLLYTPWLLREIGDADYGLYTLATSLISIFLLDFGVSSAMNRYVSRYIAQGDMDSANKFVGLVFRLFFYIDLVICLVLGIVYQFVGNIYTELSPIELDRFKVVYIIVAIYSIIQFPMTNFDGILCANERFIVFKTCELMQKVLTIAIMVVVLLSGGGLYGLVFVNSVVTLGISFTKMVYVRYRTDVRAVYAGVPKELIREILSFSIWSTIVSIMKRWFYNIMPSILAAVSGTASITFFSFASLLEGYVFLIGNAINGFFIPRVTRLCLNNQRDKIMELMIIVGKIQLFIVGLIIMGFACVGDCFVTDIWLGQDYFEVYVGALILMSINLLAVPQQIADAVVTVENKIKQKAIIYIVGGIVNICLAVLLAQKIEFMGGCVSILIANVVIYFAMNYVYQKELNLDVKSFWKNVYWPFFPCQIGIVVICKSLYHFLNFDGVLGFVLKGAIFVVIYSIVAYFVVLRGEKVRICQMLGKK